MRQLIVAILLAAAFCLPSPVRADQSEDPTEEAPTDTPTPEPEDDEEEAEVKEVESAEGPSVDDRRVDDNPRAEVNRGSRRLRRRPVEPSLPPALPPVPFPLQEPAWSRPAPRF